MVIYQVNIFVIAEKSAEWHQWMVGTHIPEVMQSRCFDSNRIKKIIEPKETGYVGYQVDYIAKSYEKYLTYQKKYAASLQQAHHELFSGYYKASRMVIEL